jgi:hypothetical protein
VGGLSVRADPSTAAERLGTLPAGYPTFVIAGPVEADGYTWFHVVGLGTGSTDACGAATSTFQCTDWIGWVAGTTSAGDAWLEPMETDCPAERDTTAYLAMDAPTRLACAGGDEWRLVTYLAPRTEGRGCFPVWLVDPFWMDPSCTLFFPQPVESELDTDTRVQAHIPPELGQCGPNGCPFDELKGSWVELVGHLDDPAAETCIWVLNEMIDEAPFPPPENAVAVFKCRLNFVVHEVTPTTPPGS